MVKEILKFYYIYFLFLLIVSILMKIKQLTYIFTFNVDKALVYQRFTNLTNISNYNDFMLSFTLFVIIMFFISSSNDYNFDR